MQSSTWILLVPVLGFLFGAASGALRAPGATVTSGIQHFAAGLVFAAAATEILPDLKHEGAALPVFIGGGLGVLVMVSIKQLGERATNPYATFAVYAVDLFVDGLVLGIAMTAGVRQAVFLTFALAVEVFFLGLTMTLALRPLTSSTTAFVATIIGGSLLLPIGMMLGMLAAWLPSAYLVALFAFSLVALLYLVVEELLVEAHRGPESPLIASLFFIGFLLLLIIEDATR